MLYLFDLLLQITPQTREGENNIRLDFLGFICLNNGILVVGAEKLKSIVDTG